MENGQTARTIGIEYEDKVEDRNQEKNDAPQANCRRSSPQESVAERVHEPGRSAL